MKRRDFLKIAGLNLTALSFQGCSKFLTAAKGRKSKLPNILILESDQHQAALMACAGHPVIKTPAMDRLAREGVRFTNAVCSSPVCKPSRTAMLTARFPHETGIWDNSRQNDIEKFDPDTIWTFPQALQQAGYHTGFIGKQHLPIRAEKRDMTTPQFIQKLKTLGFESNWHTVGKQSAGTSSTKQPWIQHRCFYTDYLRKKGVYEEFRVDMMRRAKYKSGVTYEGITSPNGKYYPPITNGHKGKNWIARKSPLKVKDFHDQWISDKTVEWIEKTSKDSRPFFLWTNWGGPHTPFDAPDKYATMYDGYSLDQIGRHLVDNNLATKDYFPTDKKAQENYNTPDWHNSEVKWKRNYFGLISLIDDGITKILHKLEEKGMLENTIVIYCSDHGEMLGNHGLMAKNCFYKDAINVPLIIRYPKRFKQDKTFKSPVSLMDLIPTILECARAEKPPKCRGKSLVPVLEGRTDKHKDAVYSEVIRGNYFQQMVMTQRYKYYRAWPIDEKKEERILRHKENNILFDLKNDPNELNNLAGDPQVTTIETALRKKLNEFLAIQ
jgi:choline-sulfatase